MARTRRFVGIAAVAALALGLAPGVSNAETRRVFMSPGNRFCVTAPACAASENLTIAAGDTVEWLYVDPVCVAIHAIGCNHTATRTATPESFDSGPMPGAPPSLGLPEPKTTYSRTFTRPGTYAYVCVVHSGLGMQATITVTG